MGTNYYFIIKNSNFAHKHFATKASGNYYVNGEYRICENPYLHFIIHLNKCSYGWRPLFQIHKEFSTFSQLENFYNKYSKYIKIADEYDRIYTFEEYKDLLISHVSDYLSEPVKWEYGNEEIDYYFSDNPSPHLYTTECSEEEAELWLPFNHLEYERTKSEAAKRFNIWYGWRDSDYDFCKHNDPDYPFDWSEGDFC